MIKITKTIRKLIRELGSDSNGAAAIEYALLATLVSTAFIMGAVSLGTSINDLTESSSNEIDQVIAAINGATPSANNDGAGDSGKGGRGKNNGNRGGGNSGNGNGNSGS